MMATEYVVVWKEGCPTLR